jgi:ATP:ADP antiporter, AAA family
MSDEASKATSPLAILRGIRGADLTLVGTMFAQFFLVITSFWILKPIKKAVLIEFYDEAGFALLGLDFTAAEAELLAKVLNMAVAFVAVVVFTVLSRRLRRQRLVIACTAFFVAGYALFAWRGPEHDGVSVWSFYLFGDLFSTVMVAAFFAFLNDSVDPARAKRLYGPIGLGGVLGGAFGSLAVATWIDDLSPSAWLLVCIAIALVIVVLALTTGRMLKRRDENDDGGGDSDEPEDTASRRSAALEGARLVWRSRYLLAVVTIVGLYEVISTIMDFQFTATVAHYRDGEAIGEHLAKVFAFTNVVAAVVQLFGTSWMMTRFGVGAALLVLPSTVLLGSTAFLTLPVLWVGSSLNTLDNAFNYSINQSAKEALYVPRSRQEKYRAKAFIDMFVQRVAKAIAVGVSLGMGAFFVDFAAVRWLSLVSLVLVVVWALAARYAGRRFKDLEESSAARRRSRAAGRTPR